jgi:hypothetical protein
LLTVACVLRSGGEFTTDHVEALHRSIERHLTWTHKFVCLLDSGNLWPGWWAKIELFNLPPPVVYFDLDTLIVGNIDDLVLGHTFTALANFRGRDKINSSVMALNCDLSDIYTEFSRNPDYYMGRYRSDQEFIEAHTPVKPALWQDKFPGRIVSYKHQCKPQVPQGASVIVFHGPPRPWTTPLWRINEAHEFEVK